MNSHIEELKMSRFWQVVIIWMLLIAAVAQAESDYSQEWLIEHDPNNNLHYYIRENDGIYVPNSSLAWAAVVLGFVLVLFSLRLFFVVGILFAFMSLHLLSFYLIYGAIPGGLLFMLIIFFTGTD